MSILEHFRARGVPWAPSGAPSAPGLVFSWILGGIFGALGHPLGANGTQNAPQIRKESAPKVFSRRFENIFENGCEIGPRRGKETFFEMADVSKVW